MSQGGSRKTALLILAGLAGLVVLLAVGLLAVLVAALQPDPGLGQPDVSEGAPLVEVPERSSRPAPPVATFDVSGRVVGESGQPIAGVGVVSMPRGEASVSRTETDVDGEFFLAVGGPSRITVRNDLADPYSIDVSGPRADLLFTVRAGCPVDIVAFDPAGQPLPGVRVSLTVQQGSRPSIHSTHATTGADGTVEALALFCGVTTVRGRHDDYPSVRRRSVDLESVTDVVLQFRAGVEVVGTVSDTRGEPIDGASVGSAGVYDQTGEDGRYSLFVDPAAVRQVTANKDGHERRRERLRIAPDEVGPIELDIVLEGMRRVTVYCTGLPDESCESVGLMMCTRPYLPLGEPCSGEPTVCECPWTAAAVRGGGASALALPGVEEVWLDFTGGGSVTGRVLMDGEPAACNVSATRLPGSLADLSKGLAAMRKAKCAPDGRFTLEHLDPGKWSVNVGSEGIHHGLPPLHVGQDAIDVGDIDLGAGGEIRGVVLDGLTGEPAPDEMVVALPHGAQQGDAVQSTVARSGAGGRFVLRPLDDGDYDVLLSARPFEKVTVTVQDGINDGELELETGSAGLLEEQGFSLATGSDGSLVVTHVVPDGGAAAAGLRVGDRLEGVTLMGFDAAERMPAMADLFMDLILDHMSGSGVGLIIERDGQLLELDLD